MNVPTWDGSLRKQHTLHIVSFISEEEKLCIWRSGVILDEGMVSDLVSGVLEPHQALQENI